MTSRGELVTAPRRARAQRGPRDAVAAGDEHGRPADPGRVALRVRVGQRGAGVRSRGGARVPAGHCRRDVGALRAGRGARRGRWSRWAAPRTCGGCAEDRRASATARSTGRRSATACAWPTPTCGSRSRRTAASAATRPSSAAARRSASRCSRASAPGRAGHRDHERRRARSLGHRQVRRRRSRTAGSPRWARPATRT